MADNEERRAPARARRQAPKKAGGATPETKAKAARGTGDRAGKAPAARRPRTAATNATPKTAAPKAATKVATTTAARATPIAPPKPTPAPPRAAALTTPVKAAAEGVATLQARRQAWLRGLLDAYEHTVLVYADYEERLADVTRLPWVKRATHAHAEVSRRSARMGASAAKQLLGA